jgi:phenylacetate-CoA ligase
MGRSYSFLVQNLVIPVYDIVRRTSRFSHGSILERTQWLSRQDVERLQNSRLHDLVKHSYETVPYYRRIFKENKVDPKDIRNPADLSKLPILTKEDIKKNRTDLVSRSFDQNSLVPYQSGGSGNPIQFFVTKESQSRELAAEFRAYGWAGYRLGDRCFMFWGSPFDLSKANAIIKRINMIIERVYIADTYVLSDRVFVESARILRKFRPEIIRGYTSSVLMMAKYINDTHIRDVRPKAVITSAETLYDSMRKTIEDAFDCPVFDYYGSREIGAIAAECEEHHGYHISAENVVVEFVDDGQPVSAGERGLIAITNLANYGMPFIRYELGDVGISSADVCPCGRGLPLMSAIEGRTSDFMASYDKNQDRVIPVGPIYPIIISAAMHLPIEDCQVIQESLDRLLIKVVKGEKYSEQTTKVLIDHMQKYLGTSTDIVLEFVDSIPPLPSVKHATFITKIDSFAARAKKVNTHY